ncbi:MAG: DUF2075 domain-containing protein [Actinomycetota bacterium]|nr:DUF2075 domain-containing protein [Actinomycetota bacterium]MDA8196996.1 DUF2075 domain-containing protein [Actinomycetota bacterium]
MNDLTSSQEQQSFTILRTESAALLQEQSAIISDKLLNWPVVYLLDNAKRIYVGETVNFVQRYHQHAANESKSDLTEIRVIVDDTFNKSVCTDLESKLIRYFASDTKFEVDNRNFGLVDVNYFNRDSYREHFKEIYGRLRDEGLFNLTITEIENSEVYKLSPFTALNEGQSEISEMLTSKVATSLTATGQQSFIIEGGAGTGKSVLLTYIAKLFADSNSEMSDFEDDVEVVRLIEVLELQKAVQSKGQKLNIAVVIPQQSLKATVERIFSKIQNLKDISVLSPLGFGKSDQFYDVVLVDEGHRLRRRANSRDNRAIVEINEKLFGKDDNKYTEWDWILAKSKVQIVFIDPSQRVRPSDLTLEQQYAIINEAKKSNAYFHLSKQERLSKDGAQYIASLSKILSPKPDPTYRYKTKGYDLRIYGNLSVMIEDLKELDDSHGLCRLVAGYGYEHKSKRDRSSFDIEIDGAKLRWNSKRKDWINSVSGFDEVGSIHTVQGYDLNYAGVIFAPEMSFDNSKNEFRFNKEKYFDSAKNNNRILSEEYDSAYHLELVLDIYRVLMSRGIKGTFVYCVDKAMRDYLSETFESTVRGGD